MAWIWADRVLDTSVTAGTGSLVVSGASPLGWRTFSAACAVADTFYYTIHDPITGAWETGEGTYSALNTVARTTVRQSSNAGALVNFAANPKNVFLDVIGYYFGTALPAEFTVATNAVAYGDATGTTGVTGDLPNFAWDPTNKRLGIGTSAPAVPLDVRGAATFTGALTGTTATFNNVIQTTTGDFANLRIAGATKGLRFVPSSTGYAIEATDQTWAASFQPLNLNGSQVTAPTPAAGDNTTKVATTAFVTSAIAPLSESFHANLTGIANVVAGGNVLAPLVTTGGTGAVGNNLGGRFDNATGRFKPAVASTWEIMCTSYLYSDGSGQMSLFVLLNSATWLRMAATYTYANGVGMSVSFSFVHTFAASDYLELWMNNGTAAGAHMLHAGTIGSTLNQLTWMAGRRIA